MCDHSVVSSQHSVEGIDCMVAAKTAYNTKKKSSSIQHHHTCPCIDPLLPAFSPVFTFLMEITSTIEFG